MRDFATLNLQGQWFAIDLSLLREVIEPISATPVPLAPAILRGVINLRGDLIPVFALDEWLGLKAAASVLSRRPWLALFEAGDHRMGILVDQVGTEREVEDASIEPPPAGRGLVFEGLISTTQPPLPVLRLSSLIRHIENGFGLRAEPQREPASSHST
jgi:purine-binding chemotaxis protein CheW